MNPQAVFATVTRIVGVASSVPTNVYQNTGNVTGISTVAGKTYRMKNHVVGFIENLKVMYGSRAGTGVPDRIRPVKQK